MTPPHNQSSEVRKDGDGRKPAAVSVLDQTLWQQFSQAGNARDLAVSWLGLQCRQLGFDAKGVVVLGDPVSESYEPAGSWPNDHALSEKTMRAAERALAERRGVAVSDAPARSALGYPIIIDGKAWGAVAVSVTVSDADQQRDLLRALRWGAGNLIASIRQDMEDDRAAAEDRTAFVLDLTAEALDQENFEAACNAVTTEISLRLDCDVVALGFARRRRVALAAISHSSQFGARMNLVRDIERAMDEAVDQQSVVLYPRNEEWDFRIDREHAELSGAHGGSTILTVPLHARGRFIGALYVERPFGASFSMHEVDAIDCAGAIIGPILDEKRRAERSIFFKVAASVAQAGKRLFGPQYYGRKIAALVVLATLVFFATVTGQYRVTAPATLFGAVERAIVAPIDGYIDEQFVRAGETVRQGDRLAKLDTREMIIERLQWETERNGKLTAFDRALANYERAEANVIASEIEQAEAQIRLLDIQIERAALRAPFDGLVLSGDLSQRVGGAVKRGDELFRLSPLDGYFLKLDVNEHDVAEVRAGQEGTLIVSAMPVDGLQFVVRSVTPVSESREGSTFFRVEAELIDHEARLRPGMSGIAKIEVDERLLILIWADGLIHWARLFLWKWMP